MEAVSNTLEKSGGAPKGVSRTLEGSGGRIEKNQNDNTFSLATDQGTFPLIISFIYY